MEIGEKIKRARQEAGITQAELARRLNVTPQTISQYERGLINPKYETALKFAEALDLHQGKVQLHHDVYAAPLLLDPQRQRGQALSQGVTAHLAPRLI